MHRRELLSWICHAAAVSVIGAATLWLVLAQEKGTAIFGLLAAAVTARLLAVDLVRWLQQRQDDES